MSKKRQFDEESDDDFLNDESTPIEDSYTEEETIEETAEESTKEIGPESDEQAGETK